jgi:hypothetical protein
VSARRGIFIRVEAPRTPATPELAKKLEEVCPVEIYMARNGAVQIVEERISTSACSADCLDASPPGAVTVVKLYDGGAALE